MDGSYPYLLIWQKWIGGLNANSWIQIQRRCITYIQCSGSVTFLNGSLDPYLWLTFPDADSRGSKTYGSYGSGSGTLVHVYHSSKQCCGSETKVSDPASDPEPYLWLMGPDPGGPKTCRSGSGFSTLTKPLKGYHQPQNGLLKKLLVLDGTLQYGKLRSLWLR